ncbi:MAG: tetratricopeptide repeat protein [Phycisphaerae bacterium]|nr:tetratricopeptide repeat protein [Phycisphaerae bacterium]
MPVKRVDRIHRVWLTSASIGFCLLVIGCASQHQEPSAMDEYRLGVAAQKANDFHGAVEHYQNAVHADPTLRMANAKLAELYRTDGNYVLAAKQYRIAVQLDPYSADNEYYLGVCCQLLRRFQEAAVAYLHALRLRPTDAPASMNLGLVYMALGQTQQADRCLQRATQLDPKSASAWLNYGVNLDSEGNHAEAESAYRRAIELQPGSTAALEDLAANLIAQKKGREAIQACEQLLLRTDSASARTRYGQALQITGDNSGAAKQLDIALAHDPHSSLAMSAKGFLLIKQYRESLELDEPKRTAALDLWRQSLAINPDQPTVRQAMRQWSSPQLLGG